MSGDRVPSSAGDESGAEAEIAAFFAAAGFVKEQKDKFGRAAPDAMRRLAKAVYGRDNSQAQTVAACLASIYNGGEAQPVQLDEVRWLDWTLLRDLITVMVGTGNAGFEDTAIREAFREIGGEAAVEWFHWYTTGGPHRAALKRLVAYIADDRRDSSAQIIRAALRSIYNRSATVSIGALTYVDAGLGRDLSLVIAGIIGRDRGVIAENDIAEAFRGAGISDALSDEKWPVA